MDVRYPCEHLAVSVILILNIIWLLHTNSYAIIFHGNATRLNDLYVIPYGKILSIEKNETVTTDNSSIAEIKTGMVTIKGTGYFTLTSKFESNTEEIKAFSWNTYLKKGTYYTYKDSSLSNIVGFIKSPTYLSVELDTASDTLKILDAYPSNQLGEIKNTYIKSFYDSSNDVSTSVYFDYSFKIEDIVEPSPSSSVSPSIAPNQSANPTQTDQPVSEANKPEYQYKKSGTLKKSFKNDSISVRVEKISKYLVSKI